MRVVLVHGFNVRDGGAGTVDRLIPRLISPSSKANHLQMDRFAVILPVTVQNGHLQVLMLPSLTPFSSDSSTYCVIPVRICWKALAGHLTKPSKRCFKAGAYSATVAPMPKAILI